jgi:serine/threonine-protein kinase HipA
LTLSGGKGGQHSLAVAGEGANPGFKEIMQAATAATIPKEEAETVFQEVKDAVDKWPSYAEKGGLSERRMAEVDYLLNRRGRQPKTAVEVAVAPPSP